MIRRVKLWRGVAVGFTIVNVVGAVYAAVLGEGLHAASHVVLAVVGAYALRWLGGRIARQAPTHSI